MMSMEADGGGEAIQPPAANLKKKNKNRCIVS